MPETLLQGNPGIRAFVAVPVGDVLRGELASVQAALRASVGNVKWVEPELCHLTLRFLGNMSPASVPAIAGACERAARPAPSFDLVVEGLGAFPRPRSARVLWLELDQGREELIALQAAVERALQEVGVPAEPRPFSPHLTLGRFRRPLPAGEASGLERIVRQYQGRVIGRVPVERVQLMRSVLGRTGPTHTVLASCPLAGCHDQSGAREDSPP